MKTEERTVRSGIKKIIFKIYVSICIALCLTLAGIVGFLLFQESREKYVLSTDGIEIPHYSAVTLNYRHVQNRSTLPFSCGTGIDVDNDGVEELFLGGGVRQSDGLLLFLNGNFINVADQFGLVKQGDDATTGAVVIDADNDGLSDLLLSRESGVWLYRNDKGTTFSGEKLDLDLPDSAHPLAVALCDLNRDGHFDMFVPLISRKESLLDHVKSSRGRSAVQSRLFINNGDDTFTDITSSAGLLAMGDAIQAVFTDLDNDQLEDLVILFGHGELQLWKNWGSLLFENKTPAAMAGAGLFMGLAVGDYNSDGLIDIFCSNSGSTIPHVLVRKLLPPGSDRHTKWLLMKNQGGFSFTDDAETSKLADYELSRGAAFADLNLDGNIDLVVSQNHSYWPLHLFASFRLPGRVLLQNREGAFVPAEASSGVINKNYSVTPLIADFNQDGRPDIVQVNLGGYSKVFLSEKGNYNSLAIQLPGTAGSLGAVVSVKTLQGKTLHRQYLAGEVLCSDSSRTLVFGLADDKALEVHVAYLDGSNDMKSGVFFNETVRFEK